MKLQDFSSIQGDFTYKSTTSNDAADLPTVSYFDTVIL